MSIFHLLPIILLPATNVVVRYRLAYHPKSRPLDASESPEGNVKPGLVDTARRIKKTEGWGGFYRGFFPATLIALFILPLVIPRYARTPWYWVNIKPIVTPAPVVLLGRDGKVFLTGLFVKNIFVSLGLIWIYRCISTRHQLTLSHASLHTSLHSLFSPYELSSSLIQKLLLPIKLLLSTPGLAYTLTLSLILRTAHISLFTPFPFRLPSSWDDPILKSTFLPLTLPSLILMFVLLPPLDMVLTRLFTQPNTQYYPLWSGLGLESKVYFVIVGLVNLLGLPVAYDGSPKNYFGDAVIAALWLVDLVFGFYVSVAWTWRWDRRRVGDEGEGEGEQERHGDSEAQDSPAAASGDEESPLLPLLPLPSSSEAGDIAIRTRPANTQPYISFWDCLRTIVKEEGFFTLYRCWWLSFLELIVVSLVA